MSAERPYWPNIELRRIANGWIVQPGPDFSRDRTYATSDNVYCFTEWLDCERFMAEVTVPTRHAHSAGATPDGQS